ncbi:MAG TPA: glycosyltransferase, partial [Candidatus Hydrogenedentes bacterium]|nr:glycosyltransferase [Candidatus Hydrogenedentota bacterium]
TRHDGALGGEARRTGAKVRVLGLRGGGWNPMAVSMISHVLRAYPPDILHTFAFGFDYCANRAARAAGVPVVISSRRQLATWKRRRHVWLQQRANKLVDCIVANSDAVAAFAIEQEQADPNLFRVIRNGVDANAFLSVADPRHLRRRFGIPFNTHVIGMVANFSPVKDHSLFVAMAHTLLKRRPDLHFFMVGHGPLAEHVDRLVTQCGLGGSFTRVSTLSERADLYALMDVSVLCSKVEGFPNAAIESMAAGTPVVAAAVGGVPELVTDGETGRLVASRDPEAFADAVAWVLDHGEEANAMAQRAAVYVREHLTVERMVDEYRALYAELLAEACRGGP